MGPSPPDPLRLLAHVVRIGNYGAVEMLDQLGRLTWWLFETARAVCHRQCRGRRSLADQSTGGNMSVYKPANSAAASARVSLGGVPGGVSMAMGSTPKAYCATAMPDASAPSSESMVRLLPAKKIPVFC